MQDLNKTCPSAETITYQCNYQPLTDFRPTVQGKHGPERICPFELAHYVNGKTIAYGVTCATDEGLTPENLATAARYAADGQPCLCLVTLPTRTRQFIYSQHVSAVGVFPLLLNARLVNFETLPLEERRQAICLTYGQHTNSNDDYRPDPTWPAAREIRDALRGHLASQLGSDDVIPTHFIPVVVPAPGQYVDWGEVFRPLSESRADLPAASPGLAVASVPIAG